MIGKKFSRYTVLSKLGEGGMGEVYLAEDTELKRKVALKFLPEEVASDPVIVARFRREAQAAAGLNHPNIITIHEVGEDAGRPYIAMAYVEGEPLSRLIERGDLALDRAIDIGIQICEGLSAAHHAGIVHRDIKPDNILIDSHGRVKILDFGLAKLGGVKRLTGEVSTYGTIYYMSPEQVRGEDVDRRSDIFSLGVVLYELFSGRLPFRGEHSAAIIYSITNEDPAPLRKTGGPITRELEQIVFRALAKNPRDRYETVDELVADLRARAPRSRHSLRSRPMRLFVPASIVVLAVLILAVFKPFKLELTGNHKAVAAENSLAVMYFENLVEPNDPQRLGEIVTNLLITDLSGSEYMEVLSSQRLYDLLKLHDRENEKVIDRTTATEVANHAGAKWMLLGSILQAEPSYILTSQLVSVETGKVVASHRITGEPGEKIFGLVDRLTMEIKNDLALPAPARRQELPVASVTTNSTEAYRYYLEGIENLNKFYSKEAKQSFEKALEYDSTFAMAYLKLAEPSISTTAAEKKHFIAKAMQYKDGVSKKERAYIEFMNTMIVGHYSEAIEKLNALTQEYPDDKESYRALGNIYNNQLNEREKAIANYRKVIEIDPMDKSAYNTLAYLYYDMGDIDNYIWAISQYITLAPDEANPYDSRGDLYAYSGKIDKAIDSYGKALEQKADYYPSLEKIGHMYLFQGNYTEARKYYSKFLASDVADARSGGRSLLSLIPAWQGNLGAAIDVLKQGLVADEAEGYQGTAYLQKLTLLGWMEALQGHRDAALSDVKRMMDLYDKANPDNAGGRRGAYAYTLMQLGDYDKANEVIEAIGASRSKKGGSANDPAQMREYWLLKGVWAVGTGQPDKALEFIAKSGLGDETIFVGYFRSLAQWKSGHPIEAVNGFEKLLRRYSEDRAKNPPLAVMAYYYLGRAYEDTGHSEKAVGQYEKFLALWGENAANRDEVKDAKARLARIAQTSTG